MTDQTTERLERLETELARLKEPPPTPGPRAPQPTGWRLQEAQRHEAERVRRVRAAADAHRRQAEQARRDAPKVAQRDSEVAAADAEYTQVRAELEAKIRAAGEKLAAVRAKWADADLQDPVCLGAAGGCPVCSPGGDSEPPGA